MTGAQDNKVYKVYPVFKEQQDYRVLLDPKAFLEIRVKLVSLELLA